MGLTCLNVDKYERDDGNNGTAHFTCSLCGARLRASTVESDILDCGVYLIVPDGCMEGWYSVSFCPNCGAKVIG